MILAVTHFLRKATHRRTEWAPTHPTHAQPSTHPTIVLVITIMRSCKLDAYAPTFTRRIAHAQLEPALAAFALLGLVDRAFRAR